MVKYIQGDMRKLNFAIRVVSTLDGKGDESKLLNIFQMKSFIGINKLIFLCSTLICSCNQLQFIFDKSSLNRIVTKYVQNNSHPFITMRMENSKGLPIYNYTSINQAFLPNYIIDENSLMRIWSMSKIVTISLFMDLVEDNIVYLDEPVVKYIPEFSNLYFATDSNGVALTLTDSLKNVCPYELRQNKTKMTIRHLINHEAGFYYATTQNKCINSAVAKVFFSKEKTGYDLINRIAKLPLIQEPGDSHFYGTNTTILGFTNLGLGNILGFSFSLNFAISLIELYCSYVFNCCKIS